MKIILIFTTLFLIDICAFTQTRNIVKTPKGQDVTDSWTIPELLSYQDKLDISDSIALLYPLATEVNAPSATSIYNCHGYAWHIVENGSPIVWIGWNPGITGEDIYWTGGSYIEVSSLDYAQKISYKGDHSAIKLNGNTCRSKWGPWSLVDHPVDYGPDIYKMSQRKYYKLSPPAISGNFSAICDGSQRTFSESTFTDIDLNYDWNCTGPLSEVDGDGTPQYTVERTFLDGTGTVSLTVTTPSGATCGNQQKYLGRSARCTYRNNPLLE